MTWRPIETAPKDGTPILACYRMYDARTDLGAHPRTVRWEAFHPNAPGRKTWRNMYGHKEPHMTHWMPVPPAPEREPENAQND